MQLFYKMKYWLIVVLLLVSTTVWADRTKGQRATVTVDVVGYGATEQDARRSGFRSAVELAVGTVIVSDRDVSGTELTKDRIGDYSAGYVDSYQILETQRTGDGLYMIRMTVTVAHSGIAERMLIRGQQDMSVDGDRLQAQMESEFDRRSRGDQLVLQILDSYPQNAFMLSSGSTEFKISNRRSPYVEIPASIVMNTAWISAFNEALSLVAVKQTDCGVWSRMLANSITNTKIKNRMTCGTIPDLRIDSNGYYFYDQETLRLINAELQPAVGGQRIALHVDILDTAGDVIDHRCTDVSTEIFFKYNHPGQAVVNMNDRDMILRPEIHAGNRINVKLNLNLSNIRDFSEVAKVRLTINKTCV
jgi:hypothetical protein